MNAILGMAELALETPLTPEQGRYLTTLKSAADSLLGHHRRSPRRRQDRGRADGAQPRRFSLRPVLGETLKALAVRGFRKGLELASDVGPDAPDALVGDVGRLRQLIINLVGNAIKFTESGEVVIEVSDRPGAGQNEVTLTFSVRDTGIGIPRDKQDKIFEAFEQADASTTAALWRHRPRLDDRLTDSRLDGWDDFRRERARQGQHLHLLRPVWPKAGFAGGADTGPSGLIIRRPHRADRRRQRDHASNTEAVVGQLGDGTDGCRRWRGGPGGAAGWPLRGAAVRGGDR